MCLDDNQEIETATVLTEAERMFECSAVSPACLREGFTNTRHSGWEEGRNCIFSCENNSRTSRTFLLA